MTLIAYYVDERNKFARVLETSKTRYNAKPDTNPPGYAPSPAASMQRLIRTCAVARTLPPSGECQSNSVLWLKLVDKDKKLVAAATSFEGSETNFRLIIYKQSPTNSANLMKIGLVDVENILLVRQKLLK